MDLIKELGPLALASRLRRIADRIMADGGRIYESQGIRFEPRWFPIFYLLQDRPPIALTEIARAVGLTHPAVNQIAADLVEEGLLTSVASETDRRKRLLALTPKGKALLPTLRPIWQDIEEATADLVTSTGYDLLSVLTILEARLDEENVFDRISGKVKARQLTDVEIVDFKPQYRDAFKTLNYEWLRAHFTIEAGDRRVLGNPEEEIISRGGMILFARVNDEIVGTCAVIKHGDGTYELSKMAVTRKAQGKQIGKRLALAAIDRAKRKGGRTLILETSHKLVPAVQLYTQLGFQPYAPGRPSQFKRTDLFMRLELAVVNPSTSI